MTDLNPGLRRSVNSYLAKHPLTGKPRLEPRRDVIELDKRRAYEDLHEIELRRFVRVTEGS